MFPHTHMQICQYEFVRTEHDMLKGILNGMGTQTRKQYSWQMSLLGDPGDEDSSSSLYIGYEWDWWKYNNSDNLESFSLSMSTNLMIFSHSFSLIRPFSIVPGMMGVAEVELSTQRVESVAVIVHGTLSSLVHARSLLFLSLYPIPIPLLPQKSLHLTYIFSFDCVI